MLRNALQRIVRSAGVVFGGVPGWYMILVEPFARRATSVETISIRSGARLTLDLSDFVQRKTYFRSYERRELRFLRSHLRAGDVMVDVGANVGVLAMEAAGRVGSTGKVVACEPVPRNVAALRRCTALNSELNVVIVESAVGAAAGSVTLGLLSAHYDIGNFGSYTALGQACTAPVEVPLVTLDAILCEYLLPDQGVRLLKIDVEGMEADVVRGAAASLGSARIDIVIAEWNQSVAEESIKEALEQLGYSVFRLGLGARTRPFTQRQLTSPAHPVKPYSGPAGSIVGWIQGSLRLHTLVGFAPKLSENPT